MERRDPVHPQAIDRRHLPAWHGVRLDPHNGYSHLLEGKGKKAAVVYTSAVWGPGLGPAFGTNFQSTYLEDWLRWTGITDITEIRYHPTLNGAADEERRKAHANARERARTF